MKKDIFNDWLDKEFKQAQQKLSLDQALDHDDKMAVMLKYQTNHISHLEQDVNKRFNDIDKRLDDIDKRFDKITEALHTQTWKFITALGFFTAVVALVIKL